MESTVVANKGSRESLEPEPSICSDMDIAQTSRFKETSKTDPTRDLKSVVDDFQSLQISHVECYTVVDGESRVLATLGNINDADGLPIVEVKVNERKCSLLLDTGSKINLVSLQFLTDVLGYTLDNVTSTTVCIKGVSGKIFPKVGEIQLCLSFLNNTFRCRFVILERRSFPADLLFSYPALSSGGFIIDLSSKTLIYPGDEFPSFSISETPRSLKVMNLMSCDVLDSEKFGGSTTGEDELASNEGGAVVIEHNNKSSLKSKSVCSDENVFVHYITGDDFKKYRLDLECEDTEINYLSSINSAVSSTTNTSNCYVNEEFASQLVGLIGTDDDKTNVAKVVRSTVLVSDKLNRVQLMCKNASNKEVLHSKKLWVI